ncbi:hypothetical protein BB560_000373 [Smittium megazygosporum]|uniref:G-patch domain-containing protein n=1 Tax=Smittium megazygosporum TaxID=133381 RepID=A0A2T9ZKN0_9FUNG|nr:hypothetical protein BB560_000373 [Smittium megazygosporum]
MQESGELFFIDTEPTPKSEITPEIVEYSPKLDTLELNSTYEEISTSKVITRTCKLKIGSVVIDPSPAKKSLPKKPAKDKAKKTGSKLENPPSSRKNKKKPPPVEFDSTEYDSDIANDYLKNLSVSDFQDSFLLNNKDPLSSLEDAFDSPFKAPKGRFLEREDFYELLSVGDELFSSFSLVNPRSRKGKFDKQKKRGSDKSNNFNASKNKKSQNNQKSQKNQKNQPSFKKNKKDQNKSEGYTNFTLVHERIVGLVESTSISTLWLWPMSKRDRRIVHMLAAQYNLKSASHGSNDMRFPILSRTKKTSFPENDTKIDRILSLANKDLPDGGFYKGLYSRGSSTSEKKSTLVAQGVQSINESNKGHQLLAKMGWTPGNPIGTSGSGITDPIQAEIRNSRRGLGT